MSQAESNQVFRTTIPVRFAMGDQAGVVFFANIFPLAHGVIEDFVEAAGIGWSQWFGATDFIVPFRHVEAEYFLPLHPGEEIGAALTINKLGRSSVSFSVVFSKGEERAALVKLTCVFSGGSPQAPIAIPLAIRNKLAPYSS